jgi:SAM-dependent methyltransferase
MAITRHVATFIVREHKFRPIVGDVLLIGRQTVHLTEREAVTLLQREGVPIRPGYLQELDNSTISRERGFLSDRAFFSMFSEAKVIATDVSDYEGAEIVHDLCKPLPDHLHGIADFIYNGGCLDNLFDPALAVRSISRMLRPRGRLIDMEAGSALSGQAFVSFSPEWFFDFYAENNYADCQVFLCKFRKDLGHRWRVHWWRPFYEVSGSLRQSLPHRTDRSDCVIITFAEKGSESSDERIPLQAGYRVAQDPKADGFYQSQYERYLRSPRTFGFDKGLRAPVIVKGLPWKQAIQYTSEQIGYSIRKGGTVGYRFVPATRSAPRHNSEQYPFVGIVD